MKRRSKIVVGVVAGVVVLAGAGLWARYRSSSSQPQGDLVRVQKAEVGALTELVNAPGEVEPRTKVAISAKVSARIIEMPYLEGATVTKGDPTANPPVPPSVLVRLDATDLDAALKSAEARRAAEAAQIEVEKSRIASQRAQIDAATATFTKAERDLKRSVELRASNDISVSDLDQAQSRYDELKAQKSAAEHSLAAAQMNLEVMRHNLDAADAEIARARDAVSYTVITSPIDGTLTRLNAKVGELVMTGTMNNPGTVILEVADLSQMLLVVQVDEANIGSVKVGQRATVRIHTYPDESFAGTVESIALTHDLGPGGAKYFKTKILLDKCERQIYSGLTADVDIQTKKNENIVKVPSQAVLGRPVDDLPLAIRENNPCVDSKKTIATVVYRFVKGKAVVTPVAVGASDATHTIVNAGFASTDSVIVGPFKVLENIKHDQRVRDEKAVEAEKKAAEKKAADKRGDGEKAK